MNYAYRTDTGRMRENNEDNVYASEGIFIVADGMGGHNAGEVASKMAIDSISAGLSIPQDEKSPEEMLRSAVNIANTLIYECAQGDKQGMGTTVDVCMTDGKKAYIGHVGDSRVYHVTDDDIKRITTDHSYVEMLLSQGAITESQAQNYPNKNVITRALGVRSSVRMDYFECDVTEGMLIMCTDGLTNMVSESDICHIATALGDPEKIVTRLVELANENGGHDNITVIVIDPNAQKGAE